MGGNFHSPFYLGRKMRHGRHKMFVTDVTSLGYRQNNSKTLPEMSEVLKPN